MKFLLLPFSWIYGIITWLRNKCYDRGIFPVYRSSLPAIVIGNLQAGGSGKTPMTAYLYRMLGSDRKIAILSRGYGRKTRGLIEADDPSDAASIGDEPLWYRTHLAGARVVVAERRKEGLQYLERTDTQLVLLDDAYQHRAVQGDVQLLLTDHARPYYTDYPLPFGRMREYRTGDKRADIILVTKCPPGMTLQEKVDTIHRINPLDHQEVFFTSLKTGTPVPLKGNKPFSAAGSGGIVALSGIANPASFIALCRQFSVPVKELSFRDHHHYVPEDIRKAIELSGTHMAVFCTEKDEVKLREEGLYGLLPPDRFYSLPVMPYFLFGEEARFESLIRSLLKNRRRNIA